MLEGEAEMAHLIRERGKEYGAVTGRPRRCGWFDAVATKYTATINGFSTVALTKLDVLDTLDEIKVCTGYKLNGEMIESFPAVPQDAKRIEPAYTTLPGWQTSTLGTTNFDDLPEKAREYVTFLSDAIGVEIGLISTGPDRDQTIIMHNSTLRKWLGN
jgi:adenylosuccinate synthase